MIAGVTRHDLRMFADALAHGCLVALALFVGAARESFARWRAGVR